MPEKYTSEELDKLALRYQRLHAGDSHAGNYFLWCLARDTEADISAPTYWLERNQAWEFYKWLGLDGLFIDGEPSSFK